MWRNFTAILYRIHGSTGYSYSFLILKYCQKMLTSKPSTLRRFWAPVYRSVISEILGPRDPAIPQRRHFVPLKPVIIRNPQTRKPANPQTRKPANPQTRKPANPQTRKPANPQTRKPANPQTRKPANPQTRKPANPQTRKPANPQTRKPANPQTRTRSEQPSFSGWCG